MAVRQVKYNDTYIYINDEVDYKETGIKLDKESKEEEKTIVIEETKTEESLENTSTDVFGGYNE